MEELDPNLRIPSIKIPKNEGKNWHPAQEIGTGAYIPGEMASSDFVLPVVGGAIASYLSPASALAMALGTGLGGAAASNIRGESLPENIQTGAEDTAKAFLLGKAFESAGAGLGKLSPKNFPTFAKMFPTASKSENMAQVNTGGGEEGELFSPRVMKRLETNDTLRRQHLRELASTPRNRLNTLLQSRREGMPPVVSRNEFTETPEGFKHWYEAGKNPSEIKALYHGQNTPEEVSFNETSKHPLLSDRQVTSGLLPNKQIINIEDPSIAGLTEEFGNDLIEQLPPSMRTSLAMKLSKMLENSETEKGSTTFPMIFQSELANNPSFKGMDPDAIKEAVAEIMKPSWNRLGIAGLRAPYAGESEIIAPTFGMRGSNSKPIYYSPSPEIPKQQSLALSNKFGENLSEEAVKKLKNMGK